MNFSTFDQIANSTRLPRQIPEAAAALIASLEKNGLKAVCSKDWSALEELNSRNRNSWFPLLPHPATSEALWVGAADKNGDIIASYGGIRLDCNARSLGERLADLTAFHDSGSAPKDEWCFCADDAAFDTKGVVAWMTAGWTNPAWRGRGVFHPLGHLLRMLTWAAWEPHWWAGVVEEDTATTVWAAPGAGRRRLSGRPTILYQQAGVERCALHYCRFSRAAITLDADTIIQRLRIAA